LHGGSVSGLAETTHRFIRVNMLDHCVDPPDIPQGVADSGATLPKGVGCWRRNESRARLKRPAHGCVDVIDEHTQEALQIRPSRPLVEGEKDGIADRISACPIVPSSRGTRPSSTPSKTEVTKAKRCPVSRVTIHGATVV
jgi:hypothetical protein